MINNKTMKTLPILMLGALFTSNALALNGNNDIKI